MAVFLILSIVFTTIFASCYKVAALKGCNLEKVNIWMFTGSTITVLAYILLNHHLEWNSRALILGMIGGLILYVATTTFFQHMKQGQLSTSWTVISLAIGIPILVSIFVWHEYPSARQIVAMVFIVFALVLFGRHEINNAGEVE